MFILTVRGVFTSMFSYNIVGVLAHVGAGALVQQFKLFAWKGGVRGFEPQSGLQVSKKENVSSPLAQVLTLWEASVTEYLHLCFHTMLLA